MIYDVFKISGVNEAIWDSGDFPKVQFENDDIRAFDVKWFEVLSAVTG